MLKLFNSLGASAGCSSTASTRAARGPCFSLAPKDCNFSSSPEASTSTLPSSLLRTQPASPSIPASRSTNQRKPTPCTLPRTTNLFVDIFDQFLVARFWFLEKRETKNQKRFHALDRYAPSAVSTRMVSPSLMKGGTYTTSPVSVFAGLVTLEAVADFSPGSVSMIFKSTVCGSSIPTALPS